MGGRAAGLAIVAVVATACVTAGGTGGGSSPPDPQVSAGFRLDVVIDGLLAPTNLEMTSDGRVVVTEKRGTVKVFDSLADDTPTLSVNLTERVHSWGDFGLLGLETSPDFEADPSIYLFYSDDADLLFNDDCSIGTLPNIAGCRVDGRLARYQIGPDNLPTGSPTVLLDGRFCGVFDHHGADLEFLPDGTLALSVGDGASPQGIDIAQHESYPYDFDHPANPCLDPPNPVHVPLSAPWSEGGALRSQDLLTPGDPTSLDGTVIRVDPVSGGAPPDNPLVGNPVPDDDHVIAFGLRNPFRMTVRPGTSELWVGDVGWGTFEEVDRITDPTDEVVENFGWPCFENTDRQAVYDLADLDLCENLYAGVYETDLTEPYWAYRHGQVPDPDRCGTAQGSSLSLLEFNGGTSYPPEFDNALFFGDYVRGCVWVMRAGANGLPDPAAIQTVISGVRPVDLEIGPDGSAYVLDIAAGTVSRLSYVSGILPPRAEIAFDTDNGPLPLKVAFDGRSSSDPEGGGLDFAWDLDGDGQFDDSTSSTPSTTFTTATDVEVGLRVTDGDGLTDTASVTIHAGNSRPVVQVSDPGPWAAGDELAMTATALDAEDGTIDPAALEWEVALEHCSTPDDCHEHPMVSADGTDQLTLTAPNHEYPVRLLVRVRATDGQGLVGTAERHLDPRTVVAEVTSTPPDIVVGLGEDTLTTPGAKLVVQSSELSVVAPSSAVVGGEDYVFGGWSDGGDRVHSVLFDDDTVLHASYQPAG